jgi:integrase
VTDWTKYNEWFRTRGSRSGSPLDLDSWKKARRDLAFLEAEGLRLETMTPDQFTSWIVKRLDARAFQQGRASNLRTEALRWFRYRDGVTPDLPRWRPEDPKEKALSPGQKFLALGFSDENPRTQMRGRFMVYFALITGTEPAEACHVLDEHVDDVQGGLHVHFPCKGHARRFVPLPKAFWSSRRPGIVAWRRHREPATDEPGAVFTGRHHNGDVVQRMSPGGLSNLMQKVRRQTGVPINWQVTRHTFATDLLEAQFGERYVMRVLGLRSMTHLPTYAEARPAALQRRFRQLSGLDPWAGASE